MIARRKIAQTNLVEKKKQETPTHGWDYDLMMKQFLLDDDDTH